MQPNHQSISKGNYEQLLQLRDKLSAFKTISCGLMHEQVRELQEESVTDDANLEELRVKRKGFCNTTLRRHFLGCAHTLANDTFARLADSVYDMGLMQTTTRPSIAIKDLTVKIYLMDHEKGMMEKRKALVQYRQDAAQIMVIENTLQEIISRHQTAINQLEQIRQDIMQQLDIAIALLSNIP